MGRLKATGKVIGKVVGGPAKYLFPKSISNNNKRLFDTKNVVHSIYCPNCGESLLKPFSYENIANDYVSFINELNLEDPYRHGFWLCVECGLVIETEISSEEQEPKDTIEQVKEYVRVNGSQYLNNSEVFTKEKVDELTDRQMMTAYVHFTIAIALFIFAILGLFKAWWLFSLSMLIFTATVVSLGLKWSYRAWQLYNHKLYAEEPKKQFIDWIRTKSVLVHPRDNQYYKTEDDYSDD